MTARFEYASPLRRDGIPGTYDEIWSVDIRNTGDTDGDCTVAFYERMKAPGSEQWSGFSLRQTLTLPVPAGQVVTFSDSQWVGPYTRQFMVKSEAGTLLNPTEPEEFLCSCCFNSTGRYTSYETLEELQAHFEQAHPEYAEMSHLSSFRVQGLSWPDHFTKYGEDYGRIISWRCICLLDQDDYEPDAGWRREYLPETGNTRLDVNVASHFIMPEDWPGARRGPCGRIPNSTIVRLFFETDQGWTGFLDDSPWLDRIPNGSTIAFDCTGTGCRNWQIQAPEIKNFAITGISKQV